jgi:two-component system, OmpR family, sensor histidine kinase KdpD
MGERVFEKFTRGEKESAKPGIGLGLAICRAIVEAHGGTIGAANRLDEAGRVLGASFWFALPVESPPPLPLDEPSVNAEGLAQAARLVDEGDVADQPRASSSTDLKPADPKPAHE